MLEVADLLQAQQSGDKFSGLKESRFYPMYTNGPEWVEPSRALKTFSSDVEGRPSKVSGTWPNEVEKAGLYLTPEGVMEVENFVVTRAPWDSLDRMDGAMDGSIGNDVGSLLMAPKQADEVPVFRSFREKVIEVGTYQATGQETPVFTRNREKNPGVESALEYSLSEQSAWEGLPLSVLGSKPWPPGLYIGPEGVISVQAHVMGLAPWSKISKIEVQDYSEHPSLSIRLGDGPQTSFPPGTAAGTTDINASVEEINKVLAKYVTVDGDGKPTLLTSPTQERSHFEYLKPAWEE